MLAPLGWRHKRSYGCTQASRHQAKHSMVNLDLVEGHSQSAEASFMQPLAIWKQALATHSSDGDLSIRNFRLSFA